MARIPLASADRLTDEQREVWDAVVAGPRGRVSGPLLAVLHRPELADRWQKFGELLRYRTSLPKRLSELAIVTAARRWNSPVEWGIHAGIALEAGVAPAVIGALNACRPPAFEDAESLEVYDYARQLLAHGTVAEDTYAAVRTRWGDVAVVELTALVGYYTMVAMTLNAHEIPVPEGATELAPPSGAGNGADLPRLAELPPGRLA